MQRILTALSHLAAAKTEQQAALIGSGARPLMRLAFVSSSRRRQAGLCLVCWQIAEFERELNPGAVSAV